MRTKVCEKLQKFATVYNSFIGQVGGGGGVNSHSPSG